MWLGGADPDRAADDGIGSLKGEVTLKERDAGGFSRQGELAWW